MFGKKKGALPQAGQVANPSPEREDNLGAYPASVDNHPTQTRVLERALRNVTVVAVVSGLLNVSLGLAIAAMLPLQRVYPYLVKFSSKDDQVVNIEPMEIDGTSLEYATEDNVRDYVTMRHTFVPNEDLMKVRTGPRSRLRARTDTNAYSAFEKAAESERKIMLEQRYSRDVVINSVTKVNNDLWQVNFTTIDTISGASVPPPGLSGGVASTVTSDSGASTVVGNIGATASKQTWQATMRIEYRPQSVTYNNRLVNPLGFTVMEYAVQRRN